MKLKIATFNAENLFGRFRFKGKTTKVDGVSVTTPWDGAELEKINARGFTVNNLFFKELDGDARTATADAIKATDADVIALQEIENMEALKHFVANYLSSEKYKYKILIDGNDPRQIDVALLSRLPVAEIRTHQFIRAKDNKSYVFSRDCLEVNIDLGGKRRLPVFVNHLKSMKDGRDVTMRRRIEQAEEIKKLLGERFGPEPGLADWIVLGDLNDYQPSPALQVLTSTNWFVDATAASIPETERWTHFHDKAETEAEKYKQLDYIFLSSALGGRNKAAPARIIRNGLARKATAYAGPRFPIIEASTPSKGLAASDHCPVVVEIDV